MAWRLASTQEFHKLITPSSFPDVRQRIKITSSSSSDVRQRINIQIREASNHQAVGAVHIKTTDPA